MKKDFLINSILKWILIISIFILFSIIIFRNLFYSGLSEITHITGMRIDERYSIEFYNVTSPISTNCIQVRKINNKTKEEYLLENYEKFDNMIGYCLSGDSMTIYIRKGHRVKTQSDSILCDTFYLNINDVKWKIK